jgi:hypothetical protein
MRRVKSFITSISFPANEVKVIKSVVNNSSREASSYSKGQESPTHLWNPKVHYHLQKVMEFAPWNKLCVKNPHFYVQKLSNY